MSNFIRQLLIGRPLATSQASHQRLSKRLALPVFSSDALSSTAYATEEILRVLLVAGVARLALSWPIALGIGALLILVAFSYRQTIFAYPSGGGAYIVARENLGDVAGLIAAASLLIDYILTVSVSVAAGVAALVSAVPSLHSYIVPLCLFFIALITFANLRGLKESGAVFAVPTYSFVISMMALVVWGLVKAFTTAATVDPLAARASEEAIREASLHGAAPLTLFLLLRAFASGCTALTGVEAISNGIPAFRKPESENAAKTLSVMVAILTVMFLGMTYIANHYHIAALPEHSKDIPFDTVLSQIAKKVFGAGTFLYYFLSFATTAILIVAANTSYADFPRLASLLAKDRFLPRQLGDLGDRLVFNNGIIVLAFFAALLIVVFKGSVTSLIPLYAVGVFISFSLSQAGMVRHWLNERGKGWIASMLVNGLGAVATSVVAVVIGVTKFNAGDPVTFLPRLPFGVSEDGSRGTVIHYGAWLVVALIPLLVVLFQKIHRHYADVARYLQATDFPRLTFAEHIHHTVLVLVPGLHRGIFPALEYARSLSPDARAVFIETDPEKTSTIKEEWERYIEGLPLVIIESPFRNLRDPIVEYVDEVLHEREDDEVTIVIPELVAQQRWWHRALHNTSADAIRRALGERPGVVVTSFRYFAEYESANPRRDNATPIGVPEAKQ